MKSRIEQMIVRSLLKVAFVISTALLGVACFIYLVICSMGCLSGKLQAEQQIEQFEMDGRVLLLRDEYEKLDRRRLTAARGAIESFQKLQSATSAGLTYSQYSERVIEMKIEYDRAVGDVTFSYPIKGEFDQIIAKHILASRFWSHSITHKLRFNAADRSKFEDLEITYLSPIVLYPSEVTEPYMIGSDFDLIGVWRTIGDQLARNKKASAAN